MEGILSDTGFISLEHVLRPVSTTPVKFELNCIDYRRMAVP
jgi:hypothetical protein